MISANYRTAHALVGDARLVLEALHAQLSASARERGAHAISTAQAVVARARKAKFDAFQKLAAEHVRPIRPERVLAELHRVLPRDAIVVADPGTPCPYVSGLLRSCWSRAATSSPTARTARSATRCPPRWAPGSRGPQRSACR